MGGTKQRKYEKGAARAYIPRNRAMKRLQLSLHHFRALCIFKGIYPVEPLHKKKVNKGSTAPKTYYNLKDIQFLSHEPLIQKFREHRHYARKLRKAVAKNNVHREEIIRDNKPVFTLKNVIRERYPSLIDALRDLDDALNLCFVYSTFPITRGLHYDEVQLCHKRTVEFQHFVMATKSLRKVFVSIKGIYFQADVKGETITWCVSHKRGNHGSATEIDFKIMRTFAHYFAVLLGHINIKLYSDSSLVYPPEIDNMDEGRDKKFCLADDKLNEYLACLSLPIKTSGGIEEEEDEDPEVDLLNAASVDDPDMIEKSKIEAQAVQRQKTLFKGMKFFLGREVPRDELTFVIRCCSGKVSWDDTIGLGSTYDEDDESITYQIVDRPSVSGQRLDRTYVQPQWVFDTFNARTLLPVKDYFPGVPCPPHLSPFVEEKEGEYVPEDKVKFLKRIEGVEEEEDEEEDESESSADEIDTQEEQKGKKRSRQNSEQLEEVLDQTNAKKSKIEAMSVSAGKAEKVNAQKKLQQQNAEEKRLAEMMIPKKHKRLYQKIRTKERKTKTETKKLQEKRDKINAEAKKKKKAAKT